MPLVLCRGTKEVELGKTAILQTAERFKTIMSRAQSVSDTIRVVAVASEEQSRTSKSIAENIDNVSVIAGESAKATKNIEETARNLHSITEHLERMVRQFVIDDTNNEDHRFSTNLNRTVPSKMYLVQ